MPRFATVDQRGDQDAAAIGREASGKLVVFNDTRSQSRDLLRGDIAVGNREDVGDGGLVRNEQQPFAVDAAEDIPCDCVDLIPGALGEREGRHADAVGDRVADEAQG